MAGKIFIEGSDQPVDILAPGQFTDPLTRNKSYSPCKSLYLGNPFVKPGQDAIFGIRNGLDVVSTYIDPATMLSQTIYTNFSSGERYQRGRLTIEAFNL